QLLNVPVGNLTVIASAVGYKPQEFNITTIEGITSEVKFELEEDLLNLQEVVVTADRNGRNRNDASIIVNTITPAMFKSTQSVTLSEGLNFLPGLRMENNCQNCGFNQLRMNGMEGPYTQILINSRPVFSGLAGVYGLELIPANMIERVEVVRGGGSALYGSNAIAGTVNLILKDPVSNSYELGISSGVFGVGLDEAAGPAGDHSVNFNTSLVSDDQKTGLAIYGFTRDRKVFDANNDGFSEIAPLNNTTIGSKFFHRFGYRGKLAVDYFNIKEERAGGNKHDYPLHERDIAEAVKHGLNAGYVTYEKFFRDYDLFSLYASAQHLNRDSYYGANRSLSSYGKTKDFSYNFGGQYKIAMGNSIVLAGIENNGGFLNDRKLGYPDYDNAVIVDGSIVEVPHIGNITVSNQRSFTAGVFTQYEINLERVKMTAGARYDNYRIKDLHLDGSQRTGNVFSPRINFLYDVQKNLKARIGYAKGYRIPQIFDEDLHIETSGARKVINVNDPGLKQETSHSYIASLDYNIAYGNINTGLLIEGFYTHLQDPFVNQIGSPDESGTVIYTRVNAEDGAVVTGVNFEFKLMPHRDVSFISGFTLQQ
ncbi:MAG TPA: TonB-dependent receptor, partial [Bacteroidales bacterium]|nr:TonB-dependent receptor [Bacteroidales bacterium]